MEIARRPIIAAVVGDPLTPAVSGKLKCVDERVIFDVLQPSPVAGEDFPVETQKTTRVPGWSLHLFGQRRCLDLVLQSEDTGLVAVTQCPVCFFGRALR